MSIYALFSGRVGKFENLACVKHSTNSMSVSLYLSLSLHSAPVSWKEGKGQQTHTQDLQSPAPVKNVSNAQKKTMSTYQVFIGQDPGLIITYWFLKLALICWFVTDWYWAIEYGDNLQKLSQSQMKILPRWSNCFINLQQLSNLSMTKMLSSEPYYSQYMRL